MQGTVYVFLLLSISWSLAAEISSCNSDSECGLTQVCADQKCQEVCDASRCGENSICRVDKENKSIHCSCKDGFIPETRVGCRLKTEKDTDFKIDNISEVLYDKCGGICGKYAICGPDNQCTCPEGSTGSPFHYCARIPCFQSEKSDPCHPSPCSDYAKCEIVNEKDTKCTCLDGYGDTADCKKCLSNGECLSGHICSAGRCVTNVCKPYCGDNAVCNIHEGKFECLCKVQAVNGDAKPFKTCPKF